MLKRFAVSVKNLFTRLPWRRTKTETSSDRVADAERKLVYTLATSRLPSLRQLKYLPRVTTRNEQRLLMGLGAFVIISMVFLGFRVYAGHAKQLPQYGGGVVEGLIGTPQYVNPILLNTNDVDRDLVELMYSGLFKRTASQEIVPDLAETFEASEDGKTYTIHLKKNLSWSDGQPITADDVLLTFELIQDTLYKSPLRTQFRNMTVSRIDESTIKFTLAQSSSSFFSDLTVGILPAHIWGDVLPPNFALIEYNVKPVGSGPFRFDSLTRDSTSGSIKEYHLVRNEHYAGTKPYLNEMTLKIYPDIDSAEQALKAKKVDSISVIPATDRTKVKQALLIDLQMPQYTAIFFSNKNAALKVLDVRKALAQAIDRTAIISSTLGGGAVVVDGPFAPNLPGAAGTLQPSYDPEAARKALDAAGWTKPEGSDTRKKGNDELSFSLTIPDIPEDIAAAELIAKNWEAIGAKVEVKPFDTTRIAKEVIKPRAYDAFLYGEILSPTGDLYPFWHSTQEKDPGLNLTTFYNKDADKLLDELRATTDPAAIAQKRVAFQQLLAAQLPAIFLYSPEYTYGLSKRVKGFDVKYVTNPSDRFAGVEGWYVKTKVSFK